MVIEGERLKFFQDLYADAVGQSTDIQDSFTRNYQQYKGSKEIDGGEDAKVVRNITYELIESQVSSYIPTASVKAVAWSEQNERNAHNIERLLSNVRDKLPFEKMNDLDERYTPIYGGSVWLVEWDNTETTHNTVGDVKVSCLSPEQFIGQPGVYEINDMEYCFVTFDTTVDDIKRKYGVELEESGNQEQGEHDKTAKIIVCYYKDEDNKICQYVWTGDEELQHIENYYARKVKYCKKCGKREELCTCEHPDFELQNEDYEEVDEDIQLEIGVIPKMSTKYRNGKMVTETVRMPATDDQGNPLMDVVDGVLIPRTFETEIPKYEKTKLPWYQPTLFPIVIRKNISQEHSLWGQSDCEFIRPQQQAINKVESRILEKLMKGGVFPIVPEDFTDAIDNTIMEKALRATQANRGLFGSLDLQSGIQQDIAQSERLYDQAKRILGISDSFQGQYDGSAQSGVAKQLQIQQSSGRLDSKRKMKNACYSEIDAVIFQMYLAYSDEPRPIAYVDEQGRTQNSNFNRYEFIRRDDAGEYYYDDQFLFSIDPSADAEKDRVTLWTENRNNFVSGAYGNVQDPNTLLIFWQNQERSHYPFAHENVVRIQAQIEQMQMLAQLQAENQQLKEQNQEQGKTIEAMNNPQNMMAYLGGRQ